MNEDNCLLERIVHLQKELDHALLLIDTLMDANANLRQSLYEFKAQQTHIFKGPLK